MRFGHWAVFITIIPLLSEAEHLPQVKAEPLFLQWTCNDSEFMLLFGEKSQHSTVDPQSWDSFIGHGHLARNILQGLACWRRCSLRSVVFQPAKKRQLCWLAKPIFEQPSLYKLWSGWSANLEPVASVKSIESSCRFVSAL